VKIGVKNFDFLLEHNFFVNVSLDGPEEIHDKNRIYSNNSKGTFKKIISGLKYIKNKNQDYYSSNINFVVTLSHPVNLIKRSKFFNKNILTKNHMFNVSLVNPFDNELNYDFNIEENEKEWYFIIDNYYNNMIKNKIENVMFEHGFFYKILYKLYYPEFKNKYEVYPNGICIPGASRLFVNLEGEYHICEKIGEFENIGNIHSGINSNTCKNFISNYIKLSNKECSKCFALKLCDLCYVCCKEGTQFNIERKSLFCIEKRNIVLDILKLYTSILEKNPSAFEFYKNSRVLNIFYNECEISK